MDCENVKSSILIDSMVKSKASKSHNKERKINFDRQQYVDLELRFLRITGRFGNWAEKLFIINEISL